MTLIADRTAIRMPTILLGKVRVSRLILGSNPFFGFAHQGGDVGKEMKAYFTDEQIMEVMNQAAASGVTAVAAPPYARWIALWEAYRARGGKLATWIAQPDGKPDAMVNDIDAAARGGAALIFIQGERVDEQFRNGTFATVRAWLDRIHGLGRPAGMGSHRPDVHLAAQAGGFGADFYFQCLYRPEQYSEDDRDRALDALEQLDKPVVAYKVLAAGRRDPADAIPFVLSRLKPKDGLCIGMYPKDDPEQIRQNAQLVAGGSA